MFGLVNSQIRHFNVFKLRGGGWRVILNKICFVSTHSGLPVSATPLALVTSPSTNNLQSRETESGQSSKNVEGLKTCEMGKIGNKGIPFMITRQMRARLKHELGFTAKDISSMTPQIACEILSTNTTADEVLAMECELQKGPNSLNTAAKLLVVTQKKADRLQMQIEELRLPEHLN
jgi:hypothetical protein